VAAQKSTELRNKLHKVVSLQRYRNVTVLSSLLAVEDAFGYIPREGIDEVAAYTNTTINEVWAVASFYTNFRFTPPGHHVVEVCWGPSCHLKGAQGVIGKIQEVLGLIHEGDSQDGSVTLKYNTCLGACSQAPVIMIDHELLGHLGPDQAGDIMKRLDKKSKNALDSKQIGRPIGDAQ
jgi:NADH:ubiquinone oxidoreductase subunit E